MLAILAILALASPPQDPGGAVDIVRLKVGGELAGQITTETGEYVELVLGDGTIVGLEKARTSAIIRAASADRPVVAPRFPARDRWLVLHDGDGRPVGWMHATIAQAADGATRIGEEWRFDDGERTVETTVLEVVGPKGEPRRAFCHERISGADGELSGERLVDAVVDDGRLAVTRGTNRGRERREYDLADGTRFPLELREELRRRPAGTVAEETHLVFDPLREQFAQRRYELGRTRRVEMVPGSPIRVRVLTVSGPAGENQEWLDGGSEPIRSEIAGPALVAVPATSEADARSRGRPGAAPFPPAFRAEPGGAFGIWLPSPTWRVVDGERRGELAARSEVDHAGFALIAMPQLDASLGLASAADAVLRWLALSWQQLDVIERCEVSIRGAPAQRLRARALRDGVTYVELVVHVLRRDDTWLATCASAPRQAFDRLAPDFDWMVERIELCREGFAPTLQGPLAHQHR